MRITIDSFHTSQDGRKGIIFHVDMGRDGGRKDFDTIQEALIAVQHALHLEVAQRYAK